MNTAEPVLIIGIGGAGLKVISRLLKTGSTTFKLAAIDTDKEALAPLHGNVVTILAGADWSWRDGSGCGGDVIRGEQAIARERQALSKLVEGKSLVMAVGGLGGGTATGGVRTIASVSKAAGVPSAFLLTTPFSFESFARRKAADDCLADLLPVTDILMRIPNDLLFSMISPDTPVEEAFDKSCMELARAAAGVCGIFRCGNTLNTDFAGFMAALRGRKSTCGIGIGTASVNDGLDRCNIAIRKTLESPFLGGAAKLESADAVIISLCGGTDLQLGETKRALEVLAAMAPKNAAIISGVNTESIFDSSVQISIVSIKYEHTEQRISEEQPEFKTEAPQEAAPRQAKVRKRRTPVPASESAGALEQGEFFLQIYSKGIFGDVAPTHWKNEDLDVPTFQRRRVSIDKGSLVR